MGIALKRATLRINNEPTGCIKIPERKRLEDALPYNVLSNISEIIIYSSCIKVVYNSFKVYTLPIHVDIPEDLPKLHSVVSYNGGYQTICAYSFNDTIYVLDNDSLYLPTNNLAVYFDYSDPIVDKDNVIQYRKAEISIHRLDDFNNELSDSERTSFYKCLGVIPNTSHVVTGNEGKSFVINKTPDGEQKLVKRDITMQITDCPTVGNYLSVKSDAINVSYDSPWLPSWDDWKNKFEKLDKVKYIEW